MLNNDISGYQYEFIWENKKAQGKKKEKKDSIMKENNCKYDGKQALNQMCLSTIFMAVQSTTFKTTS